MASILTSGAPEGSNWMSNHSSVSQEEEEEEEEEEGEGEEEED